MLSYGIRDNSTGSACRLLSSFYGPAYLSVRDVTDTSLPEDRGNTVSEPLFQGCGAPATSRAQAGLPPGPQLTVLPQPKRVHDKPVLSAPHFEQLPSPSTLHTNTTLPFLVNGLRVLRGSLPLELSTAPSPEPHARPRTTTAEDARDHFSSS